MQMLGYGEDALTLWALQYKLDTILQAVGDTSSTESCKVFFRPSFGRRGGDKSSQFGEFDFIVLSDACLYLGESKWTRPSEKSNRGTLQLRPEQLRRHQVFKFYVKHWAFGNYATWDEFRDKACIKLQDPDGEKPVAPTNSLLAENLRTILGVIQRHYSSLPETKDVLLYLRSGVTDKLLPQGAGRNFIVVTIDYSEAAVANFVKL